MKSFVILSELNLNKLLMWFLFYLKSQFRFNQYIIIVFRQKLHVFDWQNVNDFNNNKIYQTAHIDLLNVWIVLMCYSWCAIDFEISKMS